MAKAAAFKSTVGKVLTGKAKVVSRSTLKNTSGDPKCDNDFKDLLVVSSWIRGCQWQPNNKSQCDDYQKGDFILVVKKTGKRYVYPNIPRRVFSAFVDAPSKGKFYWWGSSKARALRLYSNRTLIGKRMKRPGKAGTRRR